jgi:hypothetical protein
MLNLLRPVSRDTSCIWIDTVYSDSPIRSQFNASGMGFNTPLYSVEVLRASIMKNHYGLYLEYTRDEK